MTTETFDVRTVLTATTGRLLTIPASEADNGINDFKKLASHVLGSDVCTHHLASREFGDQIKANVLEQVPDAGSGQLVERLGKMTDLLTGIEGRETREKVISTAVNAWIDDGLIQRSYVLRSPDIEMVPVSPFAGLEDLGVRLIEPTSRKLRDL